MNTIYKKNTKRKYTRKPLCANLEGICDFQTCRCGYSNILDKQAKRAIKKDIDENLHHRQKVIKRRREIELQKLDNEIDDTFLKEALKDKDFTPRYKGYTPTKKFNYWNILLLIGLFIMLAVVYVCIISFIDLIKL